MIPVLRAQVVGSDCPSDYTGLIIGGSDAEQNRKDYEVLGHRQEQFIQLQDILAMEKVTLMAGILPSELLQQIKDQLVLDDKERIPILVFQDLELESRREFLLSCRLYKTKRRNVCIWKNPYEITQRAQLEKLDFMFNGLEL